MIKVKKNVKTKKDISILVLLFITFELVFTTITVPFMVYYGPFKNVKTTVVGAAMTTSTLKWMVTSFISDAQIKQIMSVQKIDSIVQQKPDDKDFGVEVENENDTSIERYEITGKRFKGNILVINDPTRLKVGYSNMLGKEGQLTSEIARNNNAIAAINGGAFSDGVSGALYSGTGANPEGIIMSEGKIIFSNLKSDNEKVDLVALTKSGKLLVGKSSVNEMKKNGITQAVSFGPALIVNGKKTINSGDGGWGIAPRSAIAQRIDGAIILMSIDGRQLGSLGATLKEMQDELYNFGAYNASNLDGGSSSSLFYKDEVINNPCDSLGERSVPSIIYVKSK
ncbi:phosphodiester glycosidase family protein [Clostridium sp.]|uniref:phosphodiester glycosidase family protein n=1 Tax=Clostridium sp. TaxID=1506 RepID=UPI003D6CC1F8